VWLDSARFWSANHGVNERGAGRPEHGVALRLVSRRGWFRAATGFALAMISPGACPPPDGQIGRILARLRGFGGRREALTARLIDITSCGSVKREKRTAK